MALKTHTKSRGDGTPDWAEAGSEVHASTPARARHRPPKRVFVLLALLLGAAAWWFYTEHLVPVPPGIVASGTIESEEVTVASEVAGRVVQLLASEGDRVRKGDVLVRLDDSVLQLQYRMAAATERQLLELRIEKTAIKAPLDGVVTRRSIRLGEVATPGASLMVVTSPDPVELMLYVPERRIGRVKIGQKVEVRVDSFPSESFTGAVTYIATKAEFTPRNVQTQSDRMNLVFAVKVLIPNPDQRLKPGMPADASIRDD